jgi:hypothetical protein
MPDQVNDPHGRTGEIPVVPSEKRVTLEPSIPLTDEEIQNIGSSTGIYRIVPEAKDDGKPRDADKPTSQKG